MQTRLTSALCTAAFTTLALGAAQPATAKAKPEISYYLPRTAVSVTVSMTLLSCPAAAGEQPKIDTQWTVTATGEADPKQLVRVDVSSGFLAKRSNALEFYPNGTLAQFNGSSEGQGGAFIGSVLKAAGAVAPLFGVAGGSLGIQSYPEGELKPLKPDLIHLYCSQDVLDTLDLLGKTKAEIRGLEDKVLQGTATSAEHDLLERRRAKRAALIDALTLEATAEFDKQDEARKWNGKVVLPEMLEEWFTDTPENAASIAFDRTKVAGIKGFDVEIEPASDARVDKQSGAVAADGTKAQRSLLYRPPVLAKVSVINLNCAGPKCSKRLDLDGTLPIGQWGVVRELPVGSAGLFGSRQASASFDQFGTPMKLSYGSDSGGASIGSTIEAAGDTANAISDSETVALERQVKKQELRNKLRDLQTAE
ncbi:MAG: hypothetical protein WBL74_07670 [Novosphingobium sp.]|uniref:hypothetical protein n=1 Tax=Novosphingobium sp. TaxID=1874826 RepID=UPI003C7977E0